MDQYPEMHKELDQLASKRKEELKKKRDEVEKASPIFNKIREVFGSNILNTGTLTRFVRIYIILNFILIGS